MQKEFDNLTRVGCWDLKSVMGRKYVEAMARKGKYTVHFGKIFGICTQKGSELKDGDEGKYYKGRYVFNGAFVRDQDFREACFENEGSAPATMEAAKAVDCWGLFKDHVSEQCDAEQAYTQSLLKSKNPTWGHVTRGSLAP